MMKRINFDIRCWLNKFHEFPIWYKVTEQHSIKSNVPILMEFADGSFIEGVYHNDKWFGKTPAFMFLELYDTPIRFKYL